MQPKKYIRKKAALVDVEELGKSLLAGDNRSLSKAITLCESKKQEDQLIASKLIKEALPHSGNSIRIGITGVPGVGKSTFIESFGQYLIQHLQKKVAVLAVDPSSKQTKGSILGDKTRMELLSKNPSAFIRPTPSSGTLGGVAASSRESIILCEAAGYDIILVETVGVGQSETEVKEMTDFFLLLMLSSAGDELQGIKRGIMEMADGILINKAEGKDLDKAKKAKRTYQNAMHLFPPKENQWNVKVELCSALQQTNIDAVWEMISAYVKQLKENGFFENQRNEQRISWFKRSINSILLESIFSNKELKPMLDQLESKIIDQLISPREAASELFNKFIQISKI